MKVGILTWYFGNNYGAKAHSYALQHVLKDMGIDAVHIAYYPKGMWKTNIRMNLNTPHMKFHPCILAKCLLRCAKFMRWTKKQYTVTEKVHSAKEIDELGFDAIIIGSDEVFNYNHPFFDEIYYGKGLKTPLITYAPSSGQASCDKVFDETIRESLSKFVAFSARDNHTKQLIRNNVDNEVTEVLDPTLLYNFDFEEDLFNNSEPYLLVYSFDPWDNYSKQIMEFACSKKLKVICVGRHSKWADKSYTSASEYEWLSSFKHAEYVFTDFQSFNIKCFPFYKII